MYQAIIVVHVLLGLSVIGFVLIQHGKGADAGAAFGSASSGTIFGAQGASSFLSRTTAILAALFFTTSLVLAVISGQSETSSVDLMDAPEVEEVVVAPDVPMIEGAESLPDFDAIPAVNDAATEVVEDISAVDTVTEQVQTAVDESESKAQALIEEVKDVASEKVDTTLDKK